MTKTAAKKPPRPTPRPPGGQVAGANNPNIYAPFLGASGPSFGTSGVRVLTNPDPIVARESSGRGTRVYEDMLEKDTHVDAIWDTRVNAVVSLPREVIAVDESAEATQEAELVTAVLEEIEDFDESLANLLMGVLCGYQVVEVEWHLLETGVWGVKRLHARERDSFVFDVDWNPRLLTTADMTEGIELPDRKFITYRYRPGSYNPYGVGIGRSLWWNSWFKKNGQVFWMVFLEKFGQPTVVGKHSPNMSKAEKARFLDVLKSIKTETAVTISDDLAIDLLEASRSGAASYEDACRYLDELASKRVLGQTLTSDAKSTGLGGATGTEQGKVRQDILERDSRSLSQLLTRTLVRWIVDVNYGSHEPGRYPKYRLNADSPENLVELANQYSTLLDMGMPIPLAHARERFGIPEPRGAEPLLNDLRAKQQREAMPLGLNPSADDDEPMDKPKGDEDEDGDEE